MTEEKQRELQLLANSARMQVQKSVRDLTNRIRHLRQALVSSQMNGRDVECVELVVAQDSIFATQVPKSGPYLPHRPHLAPEALQDNSASHAGAPKKIPALSGSVAQSGKSKIECPVVEQFLSCSPAKEPSTLRRDEAGHSTKHSKQQSKPPLFGNGRSKRIEVNRRRRTMESVSRKCEACRRQASEPESLGRPRKQQASSHTKNRPWPKRVALCVGLVGCSPRETSSPTAELVSSPNRTLLRQQSGLLDGKDSSGPWASLSRRQNQRLHEKTNWEIYPESRGRKEFQERNRHGQKALGGILQKHKEHQKTQKPSRELRRHMEKKFAEAVEDYFLKLMTYEEKVFQRWFSPAGELQSPERRQLPPKVHHIQQEWFSPDQLHHFKEQKQAQKPEVQHQSSVPVSCNCFKHDKFNSAVRKKSLRKQEKCDEYGGHDTQNLPRNSRGDKNLSVLTIKQIDTPEPRHSKVEAVEHLHSARCLSETASITAGQKCHIKTILTIRIAESLLDELLTQLAGELRTWCGKVVDHLIDGELGTNTL